MNEDFCHMLRAIIANRNAEVLAILNRHGERLPPTAEAHIAYLWRVIDTAQRLLTIYEHEAYEQKETA